MDQVDENFAEDIYKIISAFIEYASSLESLRNYYSKNIKAIETMRNLDENIYQRLVQDFQAAKKLLKEK